jgi:hypothetical protein
MNLQNTYTKPAIRDRATEIMLRTACDTEHFYLLITCLCYLSLGLINNPPTAKKKKKKRKENCELKGMQQNAAMAFNMLIFVWKD